MAVIPLRRAALELTVKYLMVVAVGRVAVYPVVSILKLSHALPVKFVLWVVTVRGLLLVVGRAIAS